MSERMHRYYYPWRCFYVSYPYTWFLWFYASGLCFLKDWYCDHNHNNYLIYIFSTFFLATNDDYHDVNFTSFSQFFRFFFVFYYSTREVNIRVRPFLKMIFIFENLDKNLTHTWWIFFRGCTLKLSYKSLFLLLLILFIFNWCKNILNSR